VEQTAAGDLLVVTTTSPSLDGYLGELFTTALASRGVTGVVTTTGVRDARDITGARYPVWSRAVSAQGTVKATAGQVNRPVAIAGTVISPGDAIIADDDGVVCVPRRPVTGVLAACQDRSEREERAREAHRQGKLSLDVNNLRALVRELGVEYRPWAGDGQ
jgi:4-hydroxy-4-methyl-2-oxoglutarate aldolase